MHLYAQEGQHADKSMATKQAPVNLLILHQVPQPTLNTRIQTCVAIFSFLCECLDLYPDPPDGSGALPPLKHLPSPSRSVLYKKHSVMFLKHKWNLSKSYDYSYQNFLKTRLIHQSVTYLSQKCEIWVQTSFKKIAWRGGHAYVSPPPQPLLGKWRWKDPWSANLVYSTSSKAAGGLWMVNEEAKVAVTHEYLHLDQHTCEFCFHSTRE